MLNGLSTLNMELSRWETIRGEKVRQGAGCTNKHVLYRAVKLVAVLRVRVGEAKVFTRRH